jgi:hypothetical protein
MYELPEVIERAMTKNGEIQLQKRNGYYEIIFNGTFLMAAYNGNSEQLLVSSAIKAATPFPKKYLSAASGSAIPWGKL